MKLTDKSANGTSFYNSIIVTSVDTLTKILGEPTIMNNDGQNKTNFEWVMELTGGEIFTIYDWKNYRILDANESIVWHIGGHDKETTTKAKIEIENLLR